LYTFLNNSVTYIFIAIFLINNSYLYFLYIFPITDETDKAAFTNPAYVNNYSDYLETWSPYRATDHVALISMPNSTVGFNDT